MYINLYKMYANLYKSVQKFCTKLYKKYIKSV